MERNVVPAISPGAYAQVRLREPAGERVFTEALSIGGPGAQVVVPGVAGAPALTIARRSGVWVAESWPGTAVRFNGTPLTGSRDLKRDDVLTVGDAQVLVTEPGRTLLRLQVCHLVGNATLPPAGALAAVALPDAGDEDLEIEPPPLRQQHPEVSRRWVVPRLGPRARRIAAASALALLVLLGVVAMLQRVPVDVLPADARLATPGTWLAIRASGSLWLLPGTHVVTAEHRGYVMARAQIRVRSGEPAGVHLRLLKLPGALQIDTGGVPAAVSVDGVAAGGAPGTLAVAAGHHTIALRAARYLDYVTTLEMQGAGVAQSLKVLLQSSWGTLQISSVSPGAAVRVDGVDSGAAPATVPASSGVHEVQIFAPGRKTWQSSIVLKAGEKLSVGPVALGEPDAHLSLASEPSGAEVTVAGVHWGRTPAQIDLPAGVAHEVVLSLPGYAPWNQAVFADPGRQLQQLVHLERLMVRVTVRGEPAGAQLLIDGVPSGQAPQTLDLPALDHRIEVREQGYLPFAGNLGAAAGLERTLEYHLIATDEVQALLEQAPTLTAPLGYVLRLVPPGSFQMGSPPREPGRRADEASRSIMLTRPFYLGVVPVTNAQFRQFQPGHSSGSVGGRSIDADDEPVTQVTWEDAAAFCDWLSQRAGLPPAYEVQAGHHVLRRPATVGYRLPTEAEWEYAARYAGPGKVYRYAWGDSLPVPEQAGNLAGAETAHSLRASLAAYRDAYPDLAPVGQFRPTVLGLYDMTGNVAQWVNDYYAAHLEANPGSDPLGPDSGARHSVRGSDWQSAQAAELRLARRAAAVGKAPTIGFRIARYADLTQ